MMAKKLTVPEILRIPKISGGAPQINGNATTDTFINYGRPPWPGRILQSCKSIFFKSANPILNGTRSMAKKFGYLGTTESGAKKQNAVKPMIIARLFGSQDLLLHSNTHNVSIFNLKLAHNNTSFLREAL